MDRANGPQAPLKVFISYSRKDRDAAERLRLGLVDRKFDAFLDTYDILPGEDWKQRIGKLIAQADSIVFLLSPESVASDICDWEINETERSSKRLLPVVVRDADPDEVPGRLKRLNYIFLRNEAEELLALDSIRSALLTDIGWVRNHTRLGELAGEWEASRRRKERLLRGNALLEAEKWLSTRPREAPEPSALHRDYVRASREGELQTLAKDRTRLRAMQRMLQVTVGLFGVSIVALVAWLNQDRLIEQYRWYADMKPAVLSVERETALAAKPLSEFAECQRGCPSMVVVPTGQFLMGAEPTWPSFHPNRAPRQVITIPRPFAVARTPVTFGQWAVCVAARACPVIADTLMNGSDQPVIAVNWEHAKQYVAWLARMTGKPYRLLSEAEFEYAARGVTTAAGPYTAYPWGDSLGQNNATCIGCGSPYDGKTAAPVGSFKPNAFGLYDMAGNVWQWVEDTWHPSYDGAPRDGSAWTNGGDAKLRVNRGGAFGNGPEDLRPEVRNGNGLALRYENLGFRVARSLVAGER